MTFNPLPRAARRGLTAAAALLLALLASCTPEATPTATFTPPTVTTAPPTVTPVPASVVPLTPTSTVNVLQFELAQGYGAQKGFWTVYFTAPTGSRDPATYVGGVDEALAAAIADAERTIDIAAYEFNSPALTQALLDAKARGVRIRMVTDDRDGLADDNTTLTQLQAAGIPIVTDERSALMHDKFIILDSQVVWTGSWNLTINDTYRNNNNAIALRSQAAVENYQTEFNEMFIDGRFGPTSPVNTPNHIFTQDGTIVEVYFAPEDEVIDQIVSAISGAQRSVRFMTFSFTVDEVASALLDRAALGVDVQGIFERTGSETQHSEFFRLFCAGLPVRQDGNPFVLHHKVFIIDDELVVTGSFNISANATNSNDENLVIIRDPDLAAQYLAEFDRRWAEVLTPTGFGC
jgi:phosphatidylserine/phosphatidylglycerophosphate/cardiolipin synthase-like enzyme